MTFRRALLCACFTAPFLSARQFDGTLAMTGGNEQTLVVLEVVPGLGGVDMLRLDARRRLAPRMLPSTPDGQLAPRPINGNSARPIVFIHIPKSGGASVRDAVKANCQSKGWSCCLSVGQSLREPSNGQCRLLTGHIRYGVSPSIATRSPRYATVLRDPLERTRSLFDYIWLCGSRHPEWECNNFNRFASMHEAIVYAAALPPLEREWRRESAVKNTAAFFL